MFDLSSYITGLLFIHDCVILPGFGGFVANYQEATHNEQSNTFNPPSKKLVFNSSLSYNDGLLINYLSRQLNISYAEAEQKVKHSVEDAWIRLEKGETLTFEGIGTFRYNEDATLVFNPEVTENLLTDSCGLFSFRFPPLRNLMRTEPIVNNDNIRKMPTIDTKKVLRYAAVLVPIAVLIATIPYYKDNISQWAGFVPINDNKSVAIEDTITATVPMSNVGSAIEASTDKRTALFYNETPAPVEVSRPQVKASKYYLIGGSFKDRENAEVYVRRYNNEGFNSEVIETDNLYRVSLGIYDDKVKALHELRRIRANENYSKVWLYTKAN